MQVPSGATDHAAVAGVILVHGIGSQRPGATLRKFVAGLKRAYPSLEVRADGTTAVATLDQRVVRVYEAYWADLLEGERVAGTFSPFDLNSLAWFPWLNLRARVYSKPYTLRVVAWTLVLTPVALCGALLSFVFAALYAVFTRRSLMRFFDRTIADVTNYLASVGRAAPEPRVAVVSEEILARFWAAYRRAEADGCNELHVVAHSLGTVIAYHALSGFGEEAVNADAAAPPAQVRALYTIGSPLEKIRFIWPMLVRERPLGHAATAAGAGAGLIWHNFHDRLDLVSGRLRHSENWGRVENHGLFGRGGLGRAHVLYQADPVFLRIVGEPLFAAPSAATLSVLRRLALVGVSLGESGLVILALVLPLLAAAGIAVLAAVACATAVAIGQYTDVESAAFAAEAGWETVFRISLWITGSAFAVVILVGPVAIGRAAAAASHYAFRFHQVLPQEPGNSAGAFEPPRDLSNSVGAKSPRLRLAGKAALVLAVAVVGYVFGALVWRDFTGDATPWAEGMNTGYRIGAGIGLFFYSLLFDAVIGMGLWGLYSVVRAVASYRRWSNETLRAPTGQR